MKSFEKLISRSYQSISYRINFFHFRNVEMPMVEIPSGLHQVCGTVRLFLARAENRQNSGYQKGPNISFEPKLADQFSKFVSGKKI